jgi:short-subunit dehydrogenase
MEEEGRINVLVNNAGFGSGGFLEDFSMDEIREQFETNFFGLVAVTKEVLPIMRRQKKGCIVNITSLGGRIAFPVISVYNASKFAVEALTESLRVELAPFGIKVTAVEPGSVKTNFSSSVKAAKMSRDPSSPYYSYFKRFEKNIARMAAGSEPIVIARTIHKAITSKRPKSNYLAAGAKMLWLLRLTLPNRVFERMIARLFLGGVDGGG